MNLVPEPVVKPHNRHEHSRPLPGDQGDHGSEWNRLDRRFAESQADLLVFTGRHRLIAEYPGVMLLMVHNRVSFEHSLEAGSTPAEKVLPVHKPAVHLMLDEGHQNAGDNEPAETLQKKHHTAQNRGRRRRAGRLWN